MNQVKDFYDARTNTVTYVVYDPQTKDAVVIDPVLDYEPTGSLVFTESVDAVIQFVKAQGLRLHYVLETHAHADHLSGAQHLKAAFPEVKLAVGARITEVQQVFKKMLDLPDEFPTDGRQFDRLLVDGEVLDAGALKVETISTPGHTPACVTFKVEDALFTGDALFMPDVGVGRCDFPAGSAQALYHSVTQRIYTQPDEVKVFVGHDYPPAGRAVAFASTVGEQKAKNVHLPASRTEREFVEFRSGRDRTLAAPRLLFQSIQVNVDAGNLPTPAPNDRRFLKIPINIFRPKVQPGADQIELSAPVK
jgi:glyoxylase-like metal-dependent hydrolase (beta-lactamase superfamily II)